METKQKRTKVKVILSIILPVLLITGILAVSGHAKKPPSPPGLLKTVEVIGDISGTGDPAGMRVTFSATFLDEAGNKVANPDGPLTVSGPKKNKMLRYYYCDGEHDLTDEICSNEAHDPFHYKSLLIRGGRVEGKGRDKTIVFPAGSTWRIGWKQIMGTLSEGVLTDGVTYEEVD